MGQTNINIRIDEDLQGGIPFEVTTQTDPFYNPANLQRLKDSIQQMEQGNIVGKTGAELEQMADT